MTTAAPDTMSKRFRKLVREPVWSVMTAALRPTASLRVLPDYIIAGAQCSGTTTLQRVLTEHPNIASSNLRKGVHYFDTGFHHSLGWYRTHFPTKAYARLTEFRTDAPLRVGEASPYYMFHPLAPERIAATLPEAKVIVMLRDPVERTISHHEHSIQRGNETLRLEAALSAESVRLEGEEERIHREGTYNSFAHQSFSYIARSRYDWQIARLLTLFRRDRLLVLQSEAFFANARPIYERILDFLEVPIWLPHELPRVNAIPESSVAVATRRRLARAFRESNERLFAMIGEDFSWQ